MHPPEPPRLNKNGFDWFGREFRGIAIGDVFSVPLPDGSFAFGRQMNATDGANIAEFFRTRHDAPVYDPAILQSGRLFGPVGILADNIEHKRRKRPWKIVHKDPDYRPEALYDIPFLRGSGPGRWSYFTLEDEFTDLGRVSDEDAENWRVSPLLGQTRSAIEGVIVEQMKRQGV